MNVRAVGWAGVGMAIQAGCGDGPAGMDSAVTAPAGTAHLRRDAGRVWIDNVPPARGAGNGYIRGLEAILAHAGSPVAYERLMGLSGMAFIIQADVEHRREGKIDVGWWPLDPWGLVHRAQTLISDQDLTPARPAVGKAVVSWGRRYAGAGDWRWA